MSATKLPNNDIDILIDALEIVHQTTKTKISPLLRKINCGYKPGIEDIKNLNNWIKPKSIGSDEDNYKVGRCMVWYIAKHRLKINDFQDMEFPYE